MNTQGKTWLRSTWRYAGHGDSGPDRMATFAAAMLRAGDQGAETPAMALYMLCCEFLSTHGAPSEASIKEFIDAYGLSALELSRSAERDAEVAPVEQQFGERWKDAMQRGQWDA